jgi:hypothetical protein
MKAWKGDDQEMFRLQDRTTLIPLIRNILSLSSRGRITLGVEKIF